jgi:fructokinase
MKPLLKFSMDDTERFLEKNVTLNEAKAFLENVPAKAICLTCGKNGVWYKTAEQDWAHQAASLVKIKDATGAGDSFWAGFVSAFLQGLDLHTCVSEGMAVAARKLQGLQLK